MNKKECMSNNLDPILELNKILANIPTYYDESLESRFGNLIALYFEDNVKGFISCMEVAFTESYPNFMGPKPWEDPDIKNCDFCHPSYHFLINLEERSGYVCRGHQLRWMIEKSLFSAWQLRAERYIEDWDNSYYKCWMNKKRRSQENETGHPEDSTFQQEETLESSKDEPDPLPKS